MKARPELLAYCGFYCGDCFGYTGVIADAAEAFRAVLDRYQFGRTAKAVFSRQLDDYDRFYEMLGFMAGLRCPGLCRKPVQEGGSASCAVKNCCLGKGFFACYQCDEFETCQILHTIHQGLHADACVKNMRGIRQMGLDAWLARGQRHCYWLEGGDAQTKEEKG
jgi:hypothetical protein